MTDKSEIKENKIRKKRQAKDLGLQLQNILLTIN